MAQGYSALQIRLHWIVVAAFLFQLIFGEEMGEGTRAILAGGMPESPAMFWAHILVGLLVLVLALWRVVMA